MWSEKTKPTRANAKKRIYAAIEALAGADYLLQQMGETKAITEVNHSRAWAHSAMRVLEARAGRRTK